MLQLMMNTGVGAPALTEFVLRGAATKDCVCVHVLMPRDAA